MLLKDKKIAIVGAGPGGLMLARLLQMKGGEVRLYERDEHENARVQGGPLDMHEDSGLAALREAGLLDRFSKNYLSGADRMRIVNPQGKILFSDHDDKPPMNFGEANFRPEIDRGVLRKILLASLKPGTVVWNRQFFSMEKHGSGWSLGFADGRSEYADLVIAADGANSRIRPYLTDIKPMYSGITMIEGNVYNSEKQTPNIHALLRGGKIMAFGDAKNILIGQKGGGDLGFYVSLRAEKDWVKNNGLNYNDNAKMLDWFKQAYPDWSGIWHELFAYAHPPFIPRLINYMPLDQTWEALPNLTLIGDAAHVMPPFAGEGANMAMLDALELSTYLTGNAFDNILDAISAYEIRMRKRAAAATKESIENGERMHSKDALNNMLQFFKRL